MFTKIKSYLSNVCPIMFFSKIMAMLIVAISTSDLMYVFAAGSPDLSWDGIKASVMQWIFGLMAASATVIAGYIASVAKTLVGYIYDAIRARIANTVLLEVIEDIKTFVINRVDRIQVMVEESLKNDGKIDEKEFQAIIDDTTNAAIAVWGDKKVAYIGKYKEKAIEWVKAYVERYVREVVERFRRTESNGNNSVSKSN